MKALITRECAVNNSLLWNVFVFFVYPVVSNSVLYIDSYFPAVVKHYRKVETSHKYTDI